MRWLVWTHPGALSALEDKIKEYNPALDAQRLFRAFTYADNAHAGQLRKDGSPSYHPPPGSGGDRSGAGAGHRLHHRRPAPRLHRDTGATHEEIAKLFGPTVADLVEGVTKLTRVQYTSKEEEQMENLRKMFMAMAQDIRVILIKICDRLHNMRTMEYQSPAKQREKSLETMEIYAPIAHRLGMQKLKWELEDLSLRYLDPVGYKEIEDELAARSSAHEEFLGRRPAAHHPADVGRGHPLQGLRPGEAHLFHLPQDVRPEQDTG